MEMSTGKSCGQAASVGWGGDEPGKALGSQLSLELICPFPEWIDPSLGFVPSLLRYQLSDELLFLGDAWDRTIPDLFDHPGFLLPLPPFPH